MGLACAHRPPDCTRDFDITLTLTGATGTEIRQFHLASSGTLDLMRGADADSLRPGGSAVVAFGDLDSICAAVTGTTVMTEDYRMVGRETARLDVRWGDRTNTLEWASDRIANDVPLGAARIAAALRPAMLAAEHSSR
jgi:hypothetical protein